jgi:hypothetical protein
MFQRMTYGSPTRPCHSELYACLHVLISPAEPIEAAANTYRVRAISDGHTRRTCLGCSAQVSYDVLCTVNLIERNVQQEHWFSGTGTRASGGTVLPNW